MPKDNSAENDKIPVRFIKKMEHKSARLNKRVQRARKKYLRKLDKDEKKMQNKLCKLNPLLSDYLFRYPLATNLMLREKLKGNTEASSEYFAMLDSMEVAVNYLEKKNSECGTKGSDRKHIEKAKQNILEAKKTLNEMNGIQQYLRTRKKQLNAALEKHPELSRDLVSYDKSAYYYREQVNEYKNIFKEPSHVEEKVFDQLRKDNSFGSFMRENSELSKVFPKSVSSQQPAVGNLQSAFNPKPPIITQQSLMNSLPKESSIQTITQTEDMIQRSVKELGPGAKEIIEKNMGEMHSQMTKLKYDFPNMTNPADIPNFKPNPLKTKRFIDRIEYGINFQFGSVNYFFPASANLGLQVAYKITMRSSAGMGASYSMGLGKRWDNTKLSNEGFGLRSFIDYQLRGIIYMEGGYEKNFRSIVPGVPPAPIEIEGVKSAVADHWSESAMLGVKLKYKLNKKSCGTMSLMYDFLHGKNTPYTTAWICRVGWEW